MGNEYGHEKSLFPKEIVLVIIAAVALAGAAMFFGQYLLSATNSGANTVANPVNPVEVPKTGNTGQLPAVVNETATAVATKTVTKTPAPTPTKAQEPAVDDIKDRYGRKVDQNIIVVKDISIGKSQVYARDGLADIEMLINKDPSGIEISYITINEMPDLSKKWIFLRIKVYDEKGVVTYQGPQNKELDYNMDIQLLVRGKMTRSSWRADLYEPLRVISQKSMRVDMYIFTVDPLEQSLDSAPRKI